MQEYFTLFNAVTDAIDQLKTAQCKAEAAYLDHAGLFLFQSKVTDEIGIIRAPDVFAAAEKLNHPDYKIYDVSDFEYWSTKKIISSL